MKKAAKFIELSEERKTLEIGVWLNKINKFTNDLRDQEHKIDAANASYEICSNELQSIEEEIEQVIAGIAKINTEIEEIEQTVPILKKRLFVRTARLQFWKQLLSITTKQLKG